MAKVTGPLMSVEATGKFADSIVFDRRGFARGYTIPSNPRTEDQQATRLAMKAAQTAAKRLNATTRAALKERLGYRWNAVLLAECLGTQLQNWQNALTEYAAITDPSDITNVATQANMPASIRVPDYNEEVTGPEAIFAIFTAYNSVMLPNPPVEITAIETLFEIG